MLLHQPSSRILQVNWAPLSHTLLSSLPSKLKQDKLSLEWKKIETHKHLRFNKIPCIHPCWWQIFICKWTWLTYTLSKKLLLSFVRLFVYVRTFQVKPQIIWNKNYFYQCPCISHLLYWNQYTFFVVTCRRRTLLLLH